MTHALTLLAPVWQVGRKPALRRRPPGERHLHHGGHHQALRGAQGEHRDLASVRRSSLSVCFYVSAYRLLIDTSSFAGSLDNNRLCGVDENGDGTYSSEAIIKLSEALKGSAVTSLGCGAQCVFAFVSALLTLYAPHPLPYTRSLAANFLGPDGGAALAEGLKGNLTLQSLWYTANDSNRLPRVRLSV